MRRNDVFDIIVVGGGHAGCEAAAAAAKMGSRVLLITMNLSNVAQMSCNPSIGGIAKGQIVREIDALGGLTGIISDKTTIQFRMLNRSKGPAMWSPRSQNDRIRFSIEWRNQLERNRNISFWQDTVTEVKVNKNRVTGVKTTMGMIFFSRAVILANGTFLNGIIHIGEKNFTWGRIGEGNATGLTAGLRKLGMESNRMKTGTPPRVDGRSLDFRLMAEQKGDQKPGKFSFIGTKAVKKQQSCFLTYTNPGVHEILKKGFSKSPLFSGRIKGRGPRYCPSIEDKIERFAERDRHQLFVEPEGRDTVEYYVNGFSSSLPEDIQFQALRKVPGFAHALFFRPGYAIEYDYFPPSQLSFSLETKIIENLFFAGQINGTTGYEEAAAQGLMAGINAHLKIAGKPPFVLKRSEAYIGVLIDDLITKGTEEPYRMFTSRAEYRILLRQDNADLRLTPLSFQLGLASKSRMNRVKQKYEMVTRLIAFVKEQQIHPDEINLLLTGKKTPPIAQKMKIANILLRPQISFNDLLIHVPRISEFCRKMGRNIIEETEEAELQIKYENYIQKEKEIAQKISRLEDLRLDAKINYLQLPSLSSEAREKLTKIKPETIGQAARISGITPADISLLLVFLGK